VAWPAADIPHTTITLYLPSHCLPRFILPFLLTTFAVLYSPIPLPAFVAPPPPATHLTVFYLFLLFLGNSTFDSVPACITFGGPWLLGGILYP